MNYEQSFTYYVFFKDVLIRNIALGKHSTMNVFQKSDTVAEASGEILRSSEENLKHVVHLKDLEGCRAYDGCRAFEGYRASNLIIQDLNP